MSEPDEKEIVIFGVVSQMPPAERPSYLDKACGSDQSLRKRIDTLLVLHTEAGTFLEKAAVPTVAEVATTGSGFDGAAIGERAGDCVGRYKIVKKIGEGGCGVVYLAEQQEPVRREVALKVIKLGMDTKSVIARFEGERQALALMDHPNIAKVLDAGATDLGRPYFVMELVRGCKITEYCDEHRMAIRQRLEIFIHICQAVHHAHQKGVIHRDLKPSNILVAGHDGAPVPKIIDFGVAKATQARLTDQTVTAIGQFIGTPAYMSPEQATMSGLDIDTRSDIYSLGALLYELLTGTPPFDIQELLRLGWDEMRHTILEQEPLRPSTRLETMGHDALDKITAARQIEAAKLVRTVRADLDWIVMKALEKDRARRYETAIELAQDVQRHLADEPILARPPGTIYRLQKLARRNKRFVAAGVVVAVSLVAVLVVATQAALRIRQARDEATEKLRVSYLAEARALRSAGGNGQRFDSLEIVRKAAAIRPDLAARNEAIASFAVSDLRVARQTKLTGQTRNELGHYDLKLERYALAGTNNEIVIYAVSNNLPLEVLTAPGFSLTQIRLFSPNSRYLCARYQSAKTGAPGVHTSDWVWDLDTQQMMVRAPVASNAVARPYDCAANFSADSRFFYSVGADREIVVYDIATGRERTRLTTSGQFNSLAMSPDNSLLACSGDDTNQVEILEVNSGRPLITLVCPENVLTTAWAPDGRRLATGCADFQIYMWNVADGRRLTALSGHSARLMTLAFSHAGDLLASSAFDGTIKVYDSHTGNLMANHPGSSWQLRFTDDDKTIFGWNLFARYGALEMVQSRECRLLYAERDGGDSSGPEFSMDGRILAAGTLNDVRFWDVSSGKRLGGFHQEGCDSHPFDPDGKNLLVVDRLGGVSRCTLEPGKDAGLQPGKTERLFQMSGSREAAMSLDARHLAVTQETDNRALVFDITDRMAKPVVLAPHPLVDRISISPDGRWVATASWLNSVVKVWDARTGEMLKQLPAPGRTVVAFSPDGRWLATSSSEYQLWETGTWKPKNPPKPGYELPEWNFTAFSPDGKIMARTKDGRNIELLVTATEVPLATLEAPVAGGVQRFKFSPDGAWLAAVQRDQQVQLWDLRLIRSELAEMNLDWDMPPYPPAHENSSTDKPELKVRSE